LARWLTAAGHPAEHVADIGLGAAGDHAIWSHALAIGAAIVSKDEDFAQRKALEDKGPAIVWIRVRNTRKRELLVWFDSALPRIVEALERGETLIELI
jgi:predicted nuclease of predicted toxin-antitoxin system